VGHILAKNSLCILGFCCGKAVEAPEAGRREGQQEETGEVNPCHATKVTTIIGMSEDEKNAQIGAAVAEYQQAKIEVAHIEEKIDRIFKAYREAGGTMDKHRGTVSEPTLIDGKVKFGWYAPNVSAADILNETDLAVVIDERDKARKRLDEAHRKMRSLGITGLS
jgi:tetrahydromethanopterin S-methyltransferase subunit G